MIFNFNNSYDFHGIKISKLKMAGAIQTINSAVDEIKTQYGPMEALIAVFATAEFLDDAIKKEVKDGKYDMGDPDTVLDKYHVFARHINKDILG